MASLRLDRISKHFGATTALEEINLQINSGEMFFLLGPSGCGKSTLLRIIAGLYSPSKGRVFFGDRDVTALPTEQRNAVMCFQSYALWPHMSVRENIRFGLNVRKIPADQQQRRLAEVLKLVQMEKLADRKPNQLSGGQQQRVALARAFAVNPDCLLLDEPLSNLDAKLRLEMRSEIRRICKAAGFTTIYVTHDQKEALSIADRIALLNEGKLVQVGTPDELYHRPRTSFVADFIGQTNLLPGSVIGRGAGGVLRLKTPIGQIIAKVDHQVPDEVKLSIRPEQMRIARDTQNIDGRNVLTGKPIDSTFLGEASEHTILVNDQKLKFIAVPPIFNPPATLSLEIDPRDVLVLAEEMRYLLGILFAAALLTPSVMRAWMGQQQAVAPPKDSLELLIISPHGEGIRREFANAFSEYHQKNFGKPVDVRYPSVGGGGGADMRRTLEALRDSVFAKTGTYGIDLAWGGGNALFDQDLKPHLAPVPLDPEVIARVYPQPTIAGLRLYEASNPPLWYGAVLSSFGIGYNVDTVKYLGMNPPKTWSDLKDPRYYNWLLVADPTRSSTAKTLFMVMVERKMADAEAQGRSSDEGWADGMGLVRQIAANCRNFNDTANTVPAIVGSGDVAAATMIDFFALTQIQYVGDRMRYVEPANATVINADPIAMIKGAPHAETAKRFVEFLLSEPGQRLWNIKAGLPGGPKLTSLRRLPIRRSVYSDMTGFTDPVNPFEQTTSFNTSPARTKTFEIIGQLIQASCMDVLDELKATRAAILASPRAAELDVKLGRFPFDQKEALKRQDQYKKATMPEKLELMRKWADEFRQEYRELMKQARV